MITRVDKVDNIYVKRDDTYEKAGVHGGKVRTCWALAQGAEGLVTAGSRSSPQVNIVAHIAKELNINCRVHVPQGELTPELLQANDCGAQIVQHFPGYNSVICRRAKDDAKDLRWTYIPFGMECPEAVSQTASQVINIPSDVKRIVIPVGSGMSLCGVLRGLKNNNINLPVLGVVVGANPEKRIAEYFGYAENLDLVFSSYKYYQHVTQTYLGGIKLDPIYEAKCLEFLRPRDLLWIVGIRESEVI